MKKVLTVLLAIAVMFTFSFGSAFALSTDEVKTLKDYVTAEAQAYYGSDGKIAKTANSYLDKVTYDEDGYVFNKNEIKGYVTKATLVAYVNDLVGDAENTFASKVAAFEYDDTNINSKAAALTELGTAFDETVTSTLQSILKDPGTDNDLKDSVVQELVEDEFDAIEADAKAAISAINPEDYSDSKKEWNETISGNPAAHTDTTATWDKLGLTDGKDYTAKGYVKAILDKQTKDIDAADATTDAKAAVDTVRLAKKFATQYILGHKITTDENYYIEAIPTIADLKADTSVDTAKANAIAEIKAALASKQINLANATNDAIDGLDKYSKLSDTQKKDLEDLNEQKADLAKNFADYEEVVTALINYAETTNEVNSKKSDALNHINNNLGVKADGKLNNDTKTAFDAASKIVKNVKKLKDDAALLAAQKDVNGQPYYDADVLADNLEDAVEAAYKGTEYSDAYKMLAGGSEEAVLKEKIKYIDFIYGVATTGFTPKDSKGYDVTSPWNEPTDANTAVTITKFDKPSGYDDGVTKMYDKAQKAELEQLIKDTEAAIKAAKTIAEIEKIFADANDKYEDIDTTDDHQEAWNTGKVGTEYDKAEYDKELRAYAQYFVNKADTKKYANNYTNVGTGATYIMNEVVYPVVYEAYTVDELAGKVAEAKAAIDAIKTKDEVKAEKAAVEAAIKALPAASAITTADKAAIVAAADLLDDYCEIPGATKSDITNAGVLDAAIEAYFDAADEALEDAYDALKNKDIATTDAAAVEALRDAWDDLEAFVEDYGDSQTMTFTISESKVEDLEADLSEAKVAAVKELMIKLPANPTPADADAVKAARAAYEALELKEQAQLVGDLSYDNLIDAEEALGLNVGTAVKELKITAKSTAKKGSITVKWTVKGDASNIDGYEIWKSTKQSKGYKKAFTTTKQTYKNSKGLKKGTRYYYKVRAYKMVDGVKITSDWSNKAYRKAK